MFIINRDGFPKLQNLSFQSFQMEANDENAQLFDQICMQRDNMRETMGDNDEDMWVSREIKFAEPSSTEYVIIIIKGFFLRHLLNIFKL